MDVLITFPPELILPMIGTSITLLVLVWLIFIFAAKRWLPSLLIGFALLAWFALALKVSQGGFLLKLSLYPLPNTALIFLPIIIGLTFLRSSTVFRGIVDNIFQPWVIAVQLSRVMGISFLSLYARGLMPAEFAIPSGVGDVVVGITAPLVGIILYFYPLFGRKLAIVWNLVGFADLAMAIVLGFATAPTLYQQLAFDLPNHILFNFPLALVPTFAVPLSLLLHIFSLRVLLRSSRSLK